MDRILLFAVVVAAHAPLTSAGAPLGFAIQLGALAGAVAARQGAVLHPALLGCFVAVIAAAEPLRTTLGALPVVPLLLPVVASTLIVRPVPWARMPERLLPRGRLDGASLALLTITGVVSAGALVAWASWTDNLGAGVRMMESAARLPRVVLVALGIPAFAVINAMTEEVAYRGVLQRGLTATVSSVPAVLVSQALAFAALHYQSGFPNGVVGYLMVAVYGVTLGYLRHRTGGLAAPILAHVLADLVIAYVLLAQVPDANAVVPIAVSLR